MKRIIYSVRPSVTFCTHIQKKKSINFLRKLENGVKAVGRRVRVCVCVWNIHNAGKPELEPLLGYG